MDVGCNNFFNLILLLQLVMDFDAYQPDAAFKVAMEYPKLVQFVLHKLERNPPNLDGLDDGKIFFMISLMKLTVTT